MMENEKILWNKNPTNSGRTKNLKPLKWYNKWYTEYKKNEGAEMIRYKKNLFFQKGWLWALILVGNNQCFFICFFHIYGNALKNFRRPSGGVFYRLKSIIINGFLLFARRRRKILWFCGPYLRFSFNFHQF